MKHMAPLSAENHQKIHLNFSTPPKNALKVKFSVLNQAENVSMASHYHPQMRQWLHRTAIWSH